VSTTAERPAFVGRERERGVLREAVQGAGNGQLRLVFVEGEAGIGKSRLLQEGLAAAGRSGFHTLYGKTEQLERTLPFGAIRQLLVPERTVRDSERANMAQRLFASLVAERPPDVDIRYRIVEDVLDFVEKLSTTSPVLIALDDLHWADPSSLLVLSNVGRRLAHLPVLLLGAYRPLPVNEALLVLVDGLTDRGASRLVIDPLAKDDATRLATEVLGSEPGPSTCRTLAGAGGNPLLLIELARSLRDPQTRERTAPIDPSVRATVLRRLAPMSPTTRETLQVAAVLGTSFDVSHLALVVGRSVVDLMPRLDEAQRGAVLADTDGRLAFRHDLVRDAVYEDIPPSMRRALHLETGRTLARSGVPPIEVAYHLVLGAGKGDTQVVGWLRDAGRDAAGRSPPVAVELFEAALELLDPTDPMRSSVIADILVPMVQCGRVAEAEVLARRALASATDRSLRDQLHAGLLMILNRQNRAEEHLKESLVTYEGMTSLTEVRLKTQAVVALIHMGRMEEARRLHEEVIALAEQAGDDEAMFVAGGASYALAAWQGHLDDAIAAARLDLDRARKRIPSPGLQMLAFALTHADHLEEARELLVRGRVNAEQGGNVYGLVAYQWRLLNLYFLTGEWDDAIAEGEAALRTSVETGLRGIFFQGGAVLAEMVLRRNDLARAEEYLGRLDAAMEVAKGQRASGIFIDKLRGLLAEARGDSAAALEAMDRAWTTAVETGWVVAYTDVGPELVRLLAAAGDRARALEIADLVEMSAGRQNTASARAAAVRSRGLATGETDLLVQAVTVIAYSPRVPMRADTLRDVGAALVSTPEHQRAVSMLDAALALYEQLDAQHNVRAVEALLRTVGISRGRRGRRARPAQGWDALTKTELDVVALIAEGLTAREVGQRLFISPRTVETHVAHVFTKLGCSSRTDLRAAYAGREGLKPVPSPR
jgi:DNA-binding CsgD family transcriptional regulator/tetratricopeptide (TPR) repeat protein